LLCRAPRSRTVSMLAVTSIPIARGFLQYARYMIRWLHQQKVMPP
jgi:hypothetical protein